MAGSKGNSIPMDTLNEDKSATLSTGDATVMTAEGGSNEGKKITNSGSSNGSSQENGSPIDTRRNAACLPVASQDRRAEDNVKLPRRQK